MSVICTSVYFFLFLRTCRSCCHSSFISFFDPTHPNNFICIFSLTIHNNYHTMEPRNLLHFFPLMHSQDDCHGGRDEGCPHSSCMA